MVPLLFRPAVRGGGGLNGFKSSGGQKLPDVLLRAATIPRIFAALRASPLVLLFLHSRIVCSWVFVIQEKCPHLSLVSRI